MPLSASRLNSARYTSALADIITQFPIHSGLLPAEQAQLTIFQQKLAHAVADSEGTDVVTEITGHAVIPSGIAVATTGSPTTHTGATTAPGTVT